MWRRQLALVMQRMMILIHPMTTGGLGVVKRLFISLNDSRSWKRYVLHSKEQGSTASRTSVSLSSLKAPQIQVSLHQHQIDYICETGTMDMFFNDQNLEERL